MSDAFLHCERCSKLFRSKDKHAVLCKPCFALQHDIAVQIEHAVDRDHCASVDAICETTGLAEDEVRRIVKNNPYLRSLVATGEPCRRCKTNLAQANFDFCVNCRLSLNKAIKAIIARITREMHVGQDHPQPSTGAAMGVAKAVHSKRGRARVGGRNLVVRRVR